MKITCPACCAEYPLEAGFLDDDGKRLAVLFGEMEPVLARATTSYLRLFKPEKGALRIPRAFTLAEDLFELVKAGTVCRDERGGVHRPATVQMWIQGIEHMLQQRAKLETPLKNHNYLRSVVYGIADAADAKVEKSREQALRTSPRAASSNDKHDLHLEMIRDHFNRGFITAEQRDAQVAEHRARQQGVTE